MDHLQAIRAFARVVETGGFSRAAQSLQMPNATLSKAIQSLEKHLGVKLLERSTRRVSVTNDGAAYYERTQHLLTELDDVEATLGRAQASPSGRLRVDTGGSTASGLLIPALPDFCARYPDIQLQLGVTDRTVDVIGENIDCAIRSTADGAARHTHPSPTDHRPRLSGSWLFFGSHWRYAALAFSPPGYVSGTRTSLPSDGERK